MERHPVGRRAVPSDHATILFVSHEPEGPLVLVLRGEINGLALNELAAAMEELLRDHAPRVVVDVAAVDDWSVVCQAMLLVTAQRKAARGEEVVLRGASSRLRAHSRELGLFERLTSVPSHLSIPT